MTVRILFRRWQLKDILDKLIESGTCNIHRSMRVLDPPPITCWSSREFTSTCELQGGLQTELLTLFDCDGFDTSRKCRIRCAKEGAIDQISVIDGDFSERRDHESLELADGKCLDRGKIPLVSEFYDGRPLFCTRIVERVFSENRSFVKGGRKNRYKKHTGYRTPKESARNRLRVHPPEPRGGHPSNLLRNLRGAAGGEAWYERTRTRA